MGGVDLSDQLMTYYTFCIDPASGGENYSSTSSHAHFECTHSEQEIWNSQTRT